ncbi:Gaa1-like protein [Thamnocephalis sphaerospora]|uniref:Gaa1-like protein n=1 Tax=Thamnocephalis sphaerospora TaxID=78915 RepID=A0A4P9XKH1_9FUNG|nr:Gaa1-like protein [Thamnocephalis sphaerospora]|eukprot:RKP06252.1 Gaa1-like protein [Thamnocephalis sphaerospora]
MIALKDVTRLRRRNRLLAVLRQYLPLVRFLLLAVGIGWLVLLPSFDYARETYISENALMPAQAYLRFNQEHVDYARQLTGEIETLLRNDDGAGAEARVQEAFRQLSFSVGVQPVGASAVAGVSSPSVNVCGVCHAPRADHTEALLLAAPWTSVTGRSNARGVAMLLALALALQTTVWAKDLIFLVPAGAQGQIDWLAAYHNATGVPNIWTGAIQAAVVLDLPLPTESDRYDSLVVEFVGVNGQLPNLDLINTITTVAGREHAPVVLENDSDQNSRARQLLGSYGARFDAIYDMIIKQASGRPSNLHGYYHPYKIDAVTVSARPHVGERSLDMRQLGVVIESSFRSFNNLLEHFHQSFFFYLLQSTNRFISIANYLPPLFCFAEDLLKQLRQQGSSSKTAKDAGNASDQSEIHAAKSSTAVWAAWAAFAGCLFSGLVTFMLPTPSVIRATGDTLPIYDGMFTYTVTSLLVLTLAGMASKAAFRYAVKTERSRSPKDGRAVAIQFRVMLRLLAAVLLIVSISTASMANFSLGLLVALVTTPFVMVLMQQVPRGNVAGGHNLVLQAAMLTLSSPPSMLLLGSLLTGMQPAAVLVQLANDYHAAGVWVYPFLCLCYYPSMLALVLSI